MPPFTTRIKICGITTQEAALALNVHQVGFAGFIAAPISPRFITPIDYGNYARALDKTIRAVLVTVDATDAIIDSYVQQHRPHFIQLHGSETPARCQEIKARFALPLIKAIGVQSRADILHADSYVQEVDMLLFDTRTSDGSMGGTGQRFNWEWITATPPALPWFLSGGIDNATIHAALRTHATFIDISSGVESQKGVKDIAKIAELMDSVCDFYKAEQS